MTWIEAAPVVIVALIVVFVPGYGAARIAGFSPSTRLAVAAPLSLGAIAVAAIVNMVIPFRWGVIAWLLSVVALLALAAGLRWLDRGSGQRAAERTPLQWWMLVTMLVAFVMLAVQLARVTGAPENISQTFDNVYHLNGVRWVGESGYIAPTRQLLPGFYPSLWHALSCTVMMLTGASVPVAVNAVTIALGALVWPLACIALVARIAGCQPVALAIGAVLSATIPLFPMLMLDFGVLYPNVLSIALLPSALAALLFVLDIGSNDLPRPALWSRWALLLVSIGTLALAHPSTFIAFLIFGGFAVIAWLVRWVRGPGAEASARQKRLVIAGVIALGVVALGIFVVARPAADLAFWPPTRTPVEGAVDVLSLALVGRPALWAVVALAVAGIIAIVMKRRDLWWLVASYAALAAIYFVCVAGPHNRVRALISGTWYNDANRIASLFPTLLIPLAAVGLMAVTRWLLNFVPTSQPRAVRVAGATLVTVAVAGIAMVNPAIGVAERSMARVYAQTPSSPLVNTDERTLLSRLDDVVPEGDVIAGSPWTGTSLAYALSNREVLLTNIFDEMTPTKDLIVNKLDQATANPEVCAALQTENVRWVLDFGPLGVHAGPHPYPGLEQAGPDVLSLVDSEGEAKLYRIIACGE
ncbi:DUF6541 family protein [Microbacterium sp. NC79]|uniref:DUF6541 family protein n=1 Tax=Microbacterium sp. NC79 TaxID=2851009 RepID=UPI001C2C44D9|nr:DUF6541 family protein [Microbacterium sp. NC79]MBV0894319.1 hypothetical protein [Microbacterium sp. NC79]